MAEHSEIVMEVEKNQAIEIQKLEDSRTVAKEEINALHDDLKKSKDELGHAKVLVDNAIAEKDAAISQMSALKGQYEVWYFSHPKTTSCSLQRSE